MATKKKLLEAAAGSAGGGAALGVEDVFSTYLYEGNGTSQDIDNGLDLSGEGGLIWIKGRFVSYSHALMDTERGFGNYLLSNSSDAENYAGDLGWSTGSFNSNGFTTVQGTNDSINGNTAKFVSWSFRSAPKFFDVISWTGDGTNAREISHNLDAVPHVMITRPYSTSAGGWSFAHYDGTTWRHGELNTTDAMSSPPSAYVWGDRSSFIAPTSSVITVAGPQSGVSDGMNKSGVSYITYLFASNSSDGTFGDDSDQDIIKCGSYTTDGSGAATINLGWQPQWLLRKRISGGNTFDRHWEIFDKFRGWSQNNDYVLKANETGSETGVGNQYNLTPTGFTVHETAASAPFIYIAIRGGDLKTPDDATKVFDTLTWTGDGTYGRKITGSGFFPDFGIAKRRDTNGAGYVFNIQSNIDTSYTLRGNNAHESSTEADNSGFQLPKHMDGLQIRATGDTNYNNISSGTYVAWLWKRAKGHCDLVHYVGNGTAGHTVNHNLGVKPEMVWVKRRDGIRDWGTGFDTLGWTMRGPALNSTEQAYTTTTWWNDTDPTSTQITLGQSATVNASGGEYVMYLFASVAGVSKVGKFTQGSSSQTIDCGFSNSARFVLIKRYDANSGGSTGHWRVFDTERGIVAGDDPYLKLNNQNSDEVNDDVIDPHSSGFIVNTVTDVTNNGESFIFYAIA